MCGKVQNHDVRKERLHLFHRLLTIIGFPDDLNLDLSAAGRTPAQRREQRLQALPDSRLVVRDEQAYTSYAVP